MEETVAENEQSLADRSSGVYSAKSIYLTGRMISSYPSLNNRERNMIANLWIYRFGQLSQEHVEEIIKPHLQDDFHPAQMRFNLKEYIYDSAPSTIDQLVWPREAKSLDFIGMEADTSSENAQAYRSFNRYKFVVLAEATMYYRVWRFTGRNYIQDSLLLYVGVRR
ncbi:hypothetical protein TI39_contig669g00005 [Zymoseptoria brevis]|uniref:Uncharacterized protein n=1 Tax=Zymoseptoria brevis TaxID=1047168 RepID=A0A0F4GFX3_9PEZI|nr:hypothetical protein TI39_contig669g00005 [Zymoseptoria brevis]